MPVLRYFEAHLAVKVEQVKQSLHTSDGGTVVPQQPFYKVFIIILFVQKCRKENLNKVFSFYTYIYIYCVFPGIYVLQRADYRDDGVSHRVWTSSAALGTSRGFLQIVLCPFNAAAHIYSL